MQAAPHPSSDETRANRAFDALIWALSRPGQPRVLPDAGETAIIAALIDRECRVHSAQPGLDAALAVTGAARVGIGAADHVFLGDVTDAATLRDLNLGSDIYPDAGATVIVRADLDQGPVLCLSGPGVDGALDIRVGGLAEGFWQTRDAVQRYPMGFDLILLDGARIIGVPRSTRVEVL